MNTENENWRNNSNEENRDANRDGNRTFNRDGYNRRDDNRSSYNRESNYNREGGGYSNRFYGDRPQRPPYNKYGNNDRGGYSSDRPQRSFNRDDNRPPYNREGGERPYRPRFNPNEGGEQRPRFNREGGGERPRFNPNDGGQRPYGERRPNNQDRPSWRNNDGGGDRPRYNNNRPSDGGYGSPYNNRGGDARPYRPRFQPNNGGGYQQGRFRPRTNDYDPNAKYSQKKRIEYKEQFVDPNEPIRLNKYLANAGICSRREADEFITAGVVSVNGEVVTELGTKIKRNDVVKFHEENVSIERKIYILLNKPKDCVTTSDDPQDRKTVMDFVKNACNERIYPVGRLDRNTTGVLLLTNDGDLASKLTHPMFMKKKIYHIVTDRNVTKAEMDQIMAGIKLDDEVIRVDDISYTDEFKRNMIGIEIHTGQNRVVRRIFEAIGHRVIRLDRVYFAGLTKKGLRRGDWRYLTEREVNFLKMGSFN
ncbi:MAG: RNA-binding S4 domain-containing protein [Mediterranea sp.]|jgi:23S rRNA pseudouridine2605 synthase|nr:RNA-binding S4 domain-containing protein [Mediterranea sp.]